MGGLILGINTLCMLSCFLKQFALVGKGLTSWPPSNSIMEFYFAKGFRAYKSWLPYFCNPCQTCL